jgi:hypothetical protein
VSTIRLKAIYLTLTFLSSPLNLLYLHLLHLLRHHFFILTCSSSSSSSPESHLHYHYNLIINPMMVTTEEQPLREPIEGTLSCSSSEDQLKAPFESEEFIDVSYHVSQPIRGKPESQNPPVFANWNQTVANLRKQSNELLGLRFKRLNEEEGRNDRGIDGQPIDHDQEETLEEPIEIDEDVEDNLDGKLE